MEHFREEPGGRCPGKLRTLESQGIVSRCFQLRVSPQALLRSSEPIFLSGSCLCHLDMVRPD